jgi:serine/threonine protein phosphatase PrpC
MTDINLNKIKTSDFISYIVNPKTNYQQEINYLLPVFPNLVNEICNHLDDVIKLNNPPEDCSITINRLITESNLDANNQNLVRLALNSYFQDRIKLGKILAGVEPIPSFRFKDSSGQYWQGASISLAGVHTLTNSDRIFAPKNGSSILAAVADGVTISAPPQKDNEKPQDYSIRFRSLLDNQESKFYYKSNLLGQKVADAVIQNLNDPTLEPQKILEKIPWSKFPVDTAGSCTLSWIYRDKDLIHRQTIGDSPIFVFKKKENEISYTENTSGAVLTSSIHVEKLQDQKKITVSEPEQHNPININDVGWIMVASDGIFGKGFNRKKVEEILKSNQDKAPQEIIQEVLRSAHQAGSNDDISIVLVKPVSKLNQLLFVLAALICLQPRANSNNFASNSSS